MKTNFSLARYNVVGYICLLGLSQVAVAVDDAAAPLREGSYIAPMVSYRAALDSSAFKGGYGANLLTGYRMDSYSMEAGPVYWVVPTKGGSDAKLAGFRINGLLFPFSSAPAFYGAIGVGGMSVKDYAGSDREFPLVSLDAGAGYLSEIQIGNYEFALRTEVRYELGHRQERLNAERKDTNGPRNTDSALLNIGLQLPLSKKMPPPSPEPVAVVEPIAPPDSDEDGVLDPMDQCPGTPVGNAVEPGGCPLPPPCKAPEIGERISVSGCKTGQMIVIRGVKFATGSAQLEPNAKMILDGLAEDLKAHPEVMVKFAGYTDARGGDPYNLRLSGARAASVMTYLSEAGIDVSRMSSEGFGEAQPVADNDTPEGQELNRRIEMSIVNGVSVSATGGAAAPTATVFDPDPKSDPVVSPPADAGMAPAKNPVPEHPVSAP